MMLGSDLAKPASPRHARAAAITSATRALAIAGLPSPQKRTNVHVAIRSLRPRVARLTARTLPPAAQARKSRTYGSASLGCFGPGRLAGSFGDLECRGQAREPHPSVILVRCSPVAEVD